MTIGVIGAMEEEVALFLEEMETEQVEEYAGIRYHRGRLAGADAVVCKSGVGKVNAAICTQILIDRFNVKAIVFTGVAGALHPDLDIGDLVISTSCQQHDMDVTALGFAPGQIPFQAVSVFPADERLIRLAEEAARRAADVKTVKGKVLSGDQFISSSEKVAELREKWEGVCVEMEGAAVAHVCYANRVPYVVIRSMSDRADHSANVNFAEFTKLAAERSCAIVREMLNRWNG
ncbi:5'-methylthioadenosine/adenosylhomocysteine nucleosidase [Polycladomyces subterraneus]|uniref:adenosylhomocysteine nucleosidase n=1 Tax=Polycladomyces subterraneus TaxID=1016997 RepID=A0ABT8IRB3_9BACL|nr:5'-methylthioadenosine/adenosylhomocysteine nucleosidase [Polycladomyces subterraneus]MDN4595344.1 5'-methylthioadenosine/adenosylhomocysteine nucleosidase [Polycladomyces subterraneus]